MKSKKVILFFPNTGFDIKGVSVDLPLAVLNLAAFIQKEFDVCLIDQRLESDWRGRLITELKKGPLCFGLSALTSPQILYGLEASKLVRKFSPDTMVVWGGVHPTLMPKSTLRNPLVDVIVRDQGEIPFLKFLQAIYTDQDADLTKLPSLSFVKDEQYIETPLEIEPVDRLDRFPELPYHLLRAGVEPYIGSQGRFVDPNARSLIMITSVGCPYRCTYCAMPGMDSTRTQVTESAEFTVSRIIKLIENYNINAIAFHDEEFMVNPKRTIALAEQIIKVIGGRKNGFRWWCQARMDTIERLANYKGKNYLPLLAESGLESFQPGIESGSDRILGLIKKRETKDDFIRINKLLSQYPEFQPLYNFMVGFPTETIDEMKETLSLAEQMVSDNTNAMIAGVYILVPYPGTEIYDVAINAGFVPPSTLEEWAEFNRQQLLTPWVKNNPEVLQLAEFARLTSRFIDGKRLPLRLDHSLGGRSGLKQEDFKQFSNLLKERWRTGDFSDIEIFRTFNRLVLSMFDLAKNIDEDENLNINNIGVDERTKELIVDTALPLGGNEIKNRDEEYQKSRDNLVKTKTLPKRKISGFSDSHGIEEGKTTSSIK